MTALLTGAWWAQKLTGITAQAVALAVSVAVALAVVVGGLWWLRHDARQDERAAVETRVAKAWIAELSRAEARQRQSEAVAAKAAVQWATDLAASEAARVELETKLAALQARRVCYPKEIVKALNK